MFSREVGFKEVKERVQRIYSEYNLLRQRNSMKKSGLYKGLSHQEKN